MVFVFKHPKIRLEVLGMIHGHLTHFHLPYLSQAAGISPIFLYPFLPPYLSLSLGLHPLCFVVFLSFNSRKIHTHLTFIYSSPTLLVPLTSIPVCLSISSCHLNLVWYRCRKSSWIFLLYNKISSIKKWDFIGRSLFGK